MSDSVVCQCTVRMIDTETGEELAISSTETNLGDINFYKDKTKAGFMRNIDIAEDGIAKTSSDASRECLISFIKKKQKNQH